jgi:hypothetical protein
MATELSYVEEYSLWQEHRVKLKQPKTFLALAHRKVQAGVIHTIRREVSLVEVQFAAIGQSMLRLAWVLLIKEQQESEAVWLKGGFCHEEELGPLLEWSLRLSLLLERFWKLPGPHDVYSPLNSVCLLGLLINWSWQGRVREWLVILIWDLSDLYLIQFKESAPPPTHQDFQKSLIFELKVS